MKKIVISLMGLLLISLTGCAVVMTRFAHTGNKTYPAYNTDVVGICWMAEGREKKHINNFEFYGISTLCVIDMVPSVVVDTVLFPWDYFKPEKDTY